MPDTEITYLSKKILGEVSLVEKFKDYYRHECINKYFPYYIHCDLVASIDSLPLDSRFYGFKSQKYIDIIYNDIKYSFYMYGGDVFYYLMEPFLIDIYDKPFYKFNKATFIKDNKKYKKAIKAQILM